MLITKEMLEDLYLNQHLTYQEIGNLHGVTRNRICQLIKNYGIDTSQGERFPITCDFCGEPYLIHRKHFKSFLSHFCSSDCYYASKSAHSLYIPHRQGQRVARKTMEAIIGRPLTSKEVVHHEDGNCENNAESNLILFPSQVEHLKHHHRKRIQAIAKKRESI